MKPSELKETEEIILKPEHGTTLRIAFDREYGMLSMYVYREDDEFDAISIHADSEEDLDRLYAAAIRNRAEIVKVRKVN